MIDAQSLTRHYGKLSAVDGVTFQIEQNTIVGLLGHNGAGKSTLMKMLSGYLEPSAGSLVVAGNNYAQGCRAVQKMLGYLPEALPLYPEMIVADYLDFSAACKGIARQERSRALREVMLATDISEQMLWPIHRLSTCLRQRLGVAQAILGSPRLLILDEPTRGLDPEQSQNMRALIKRLARRATVVLSSHIMAEVDALCDRVLILHQGRLALDASLADLRSSNTLQLRVLQSSESLHQALAALQEVASVEGLADDNSYTLRLRDKVKPDVASAAIAKCVAHSGASLCTLQPQQRDLESVFHEATHGAISR
ncbi:ABC transporter ATP-binding protein [Parahaliea sp. F7430]|uniref:ABC transporter ATP-binding protein n=1 Tax=Sediminihaliea albiluteola TaxID=2758564 RepID=A0A7W2YJV0_9GAMM|nr:ABC transporter ATP-binding protein [Sediminihaliea albiluteola]MBA6413482.1 ABC transporter ATP-binding protein [Sediminihaliea albiluteola]